MIRYRQAIWLLLATVIAVVVAVTAMVEPAGAQGPADDPPDHVMSLFDIVTSAAKDWLAIVGTVVTIALAIGGVFLAWRNAQIFRAKSPHVTISHKVSHRPVGTSYVHIFVTAILHNSSRVHIEFLDGFATLRQVNPIDDRDVELLYEQVFVDQDFDNFEWPALDTLRHHWNRDGLLVEPGETETEIFDFVVQRDVEAVAIRTYFYNARVVGKLPDGIPLDAVRRRKGRYRLWRTERGPLGWGRTSVHDIVELS